MRPKLYLIKLNLWYLRVDKKIKPLGWGWREKTEATPLDLPSAESWERTLIGFYGKGIVKTVMDKSLASATPAKRSAKATRKKKVGEKRK